ncbi:rootletin-like isoform X1 [Micropterus dolomieu]|uniref:rootletin-like isoform X1 n=1 Tax=Micropterus dolomieu TaxID=147949 RepID=UPI001E8E5B8A|nr:rootletin-like isoform X1 [Micropterus dolomieu]XP_045887271.1 rootletin-like isoform X1 [Micropterus dolomieu]XP_045887272.1 rootletin-like isoform X1 [Micropterus dolomieu]XP_045887273.1 rootletin-like isoform X1 [Micropterus dolomieu]
MQHSQRLDQRLHMLREEVRNMNQEKERGERVWRDRLQRCQRQLKAKEEEMSRQSLYFENFKTQLQQKLSLAQDREQGLQNRIYTLEKQLLDMTVSAATGVATISAVRFTAGTVTQQEEQERLLSMRGEGEGEEERKEERRRQWQPSVGVEREGGREGDEEKTKKETQGGRVKLKDTKQNSNEARLQGFILSLQEDLRVLLEREEDGMTERRRLMEQLQEAQENSHFLGCKVEEMKAEAHQLKVSESSLMEEIDELRGANHRLRQIIGDADNQTPRQSSRVPESTCTGPGTSLPSCSPALPSNNLSHTTTIGHFSMGSSGEVHHTSNEETGQTHSSPVLPVHHQAAAEHTQTNTEERFSSAKTETPPKNDPLNLFCHLGSKTNPSLQSLSLTAETLEEFKLGTWCSSEILNLEESPSEESDALKEAYRSLGLGEDLEALQQQCNRLEVTLQHTQEQLQMMAQENTRLKLQLRKEAEEEQAEAQQGSSREKISTLPASDGEDDLVKALNQENRALADRIRQLLGHIEVREEEIKRGETQLRQHITNVEADRVRLEQENQEQGCLITELNQKTEDDLNTIMELQQRLEESQQHMEESHFDKEPCGSQLQGEYTAAVSGSFQQNNLEECVDILVERVLNGEEPQLMSSQQPDNLTTASAPGSQHNNCYDPLQNGMQSSQHVSSLTDQVHLLTKSVQSLKTEQEELSGDINSLREQQREVAMSVQTQTEVKQQLTRTVWGLKEERDSISQSLAGLKQEREQLTRTVYGLKDESNQFIRSTSGLKEEKEHLSEALSALEREKEKLLEFLSRGKAERDQTMQSVQRLQSESDQLSQAVLYLKQERDKLTNSLKCLKEQRDKEQSSSTLQEDQGELKKSVSSLQEEKERIESSIGCLKTEEKHIKLLLQGLREESLQAALPSQTQTEGRDQKQHLLNPNTAVTTKKTKTSVGTDEYATQRCQTDDHSGTSLLMQHVFDGKQVQSDLMRETEALGAELKRSRYELEKSHVDTNMLHSELHQAEVRREEAERKAAADEVMRLTDVANQMEETRKENDSLITQVKQLRSELTGLVREKTDALSLKAQIEEQYNILTAQLKAKTVALEELNSEYIALKRGQGGKEDPGTVLISLRTRYNDIRVKYDALLKKKSQNDLEIAPLKAKLSCLVVKCQERNSLLFQMMKAMHRRGCVDSTLTQQVEQLLSDAALQDYAAAFTPRSVNVKTRDYSTWFTPGFFKFQDYTNGLTPDQTCSTIPTLVNQHYQNGLTTESRVKCRELKSEKHRSSVTTESMTKHQDCSSEVTLASTVTLKENANSPVQEHASVQATPSPVVPSPKASLIITTAQLSPAASGSVQVTSGPENLGFHHPDMKGKSSLDLASSTGSSRSPTPPSSNTRVSRGRRLSSPEKIINLHEQLQKTLMSSYQAPVSRGRGSQPRECLPFPAHTDLRPASQTKTQSLTFSISHTNSLLVTTPSSPAKHTPAVTATPVATNKSTTLFDTVSSRSASVTFGTNMFTDFKADRSKTTTSALSSSYNFPFATMAPSKSTSSSATNGAISPKQTMKITAIPDLSDAKHTASTPLTFDSDVFISSDTNPKTTASDTTACSISTAPKASHFNRPSKTDGASPTYDRLVSAASCAHSAHRSPERSNKSARKSVTALEKTKSARPEAPAEVRSVEVIKTVGQSSLMIGWERPPLDELGCSNGTFVYGYRVFVDGDFHKSVMSSACTKCILENVDLSVPVHISVQTLGSNGLGSNSVHTMYGTDHH